MGDEDKLEPALESKHQRQKSNSETKKHDDPAYDPHTTSSGPLSRASSGRARPSILRIKGREYMSSNERKRLRRRLGRYGKEKRESDIKVFFNNTISVILVPSVTDTTGPEKVDFEFKGYFLLEHQVKEALNMTLDLDELEFTDSRTAYHYWCDILRSRQRLRSLSNQNAFIQLNHIVNGRPLDVVSLPKDVSLSEFRETGKNKNPYNAILVNQKVDRKYLGTGKLNAELKVLKSRVDNILRVVGFTRNARRSSFYDLEEGYKNQLGEIGERYNDKFTFLKDPVVQGAFARCITFKMFMEKLKTKENAKILSVMTGTEVLSLTAPRHVFLGAISHLREIYRMLYKMSRLWDEGVNLSLESREELVDTYQRGRTRDRSVFCKVLVHENGNQYRCLGTKSIVRKYSEGSETFYQLHTLFSIKPADKSKFPSVNSRIPDPDIILSNDFKLVPFMIFNFKKFLKTTKELWLKTYIDRVNAGMLCAMVNNNVRLLAFFEQLEFPFVVHGISAALACSKDDVVIPQKEPNNVLKVFKKTIRNKKKTKERVKVSGQSLFLNPFVRADLYYSKVKGVRTLTNTEGYSGRLLATLLTLGNISMVKYLLKNGFPLKRRIFSYETIKLSWENVPRLESKARSQKRKLQKKNGVFFDPFLSEMDEINITKDKKIHLTSSYKLRTVTSYAVESFFNNLFSKQKEFETANIKAHKKRIKAKYDFTIKLIRDKKVKIMDNNADILRRLVPALASYVKALRRFKREGQAFDHRLHIKFLLRQARKAYKKSLKLKKKVPRRVIQSYVTFLSLKLIQEIIKRSLRELKNARNFKLVLIVLIDECIQTDNFNVVPFISTNISIIQKALKFTAAKLRTENIHTNKQLLKGAVVLRKMFSMELDEVIIQEFVGSRNFQRLLDSNCSLKAGEATYLMKFLKFNEVRRFLSTFSVKDLSQIFASLLVNGINADWMQELLIEKSYGKEFEEIETDITDFVFIKKQGLSRVAQNAFITVRSQLNLFKKMLTNGPHSNTFQVVDFLNRQYPDFLFEMDHLTVLNFFINLLLSSSIKMPQPRSYYADLSALRLYMHLKDLYFFRDLYDRQLELGSDMCFILKSISGEDRKIASSHLLFDFIGTVHKFLIDGYSLCDDSERDELSEMSRKILSQCALPNSFLFDWSPDVDKILIRAGQIKKKD